jgi:hypothetical protein
MLVASRYSTINGPDVLLLESSRRSITSTDINPCLGPKYACRLEVGRRLSRAEIVFPISFPFFASYVPMENQNPSKKLWDRPS